MATTTTTPQPLIVKTSSDVRDDILRTIRNGLIEQGISNPQVTLTSDFGLIAAALGQEVTIPASNAVILANQGMPDTATGTDLDRILGFYNLTRRAASQSSGAIIASAGATSFVPLGSQLVDSSGNTFQVTIGGTYGNGAAIPVQSVNAGSSTNEDAGTSLTWSSPPPFFAPTAIVSTINPITGGEDVETDDVARTRLIAFLSNPPGGANPSQIIQWAQAADTSVQTAFVSCAARGPGTVDVVTVTYANSNDGYRDSNLLLLTNKIAPYIQGQLPQYVDGYVCTVQNYPMDISIGLSLPLPPSSIPSGPGGGWLDPAPLQVTTAKPAIRICDGYALSGQTSGVPQNTATSFWVDFPQPPQGGVQYSISYVSPETLTLYQGVTSGTYIPATNYGSISAYTTMWYVTVNSPFYFNANLNIIIQPGDWIFPSAVNTATYVTTMLTYIAGMGPGERTANTGLLPRAYRQPYDTTSGPYKLNSRIVKPIIDSGPEVYDGVLLFRGSYVNSGTTPTAPFVDYGTIVFNADPAYAVYAPPTTYNFFGTMQAPSNIFVPNNIGFYVSSQ
jgi:Baseplate J-like protein